MGVLSLLKRFRAEEGVMAVEFSFIAPVMIGTMFGMIELTDAIMARRRVDMAASMMGDLATNIVDNWIHEDDLESIFDVGGDVLHPYGIDNVDVRMAAVTWDEEDEELVVVWARCEFSDREVVDSEDEDRVCDQPGDVYDRLGSNVSLEDTETLVGDNYHLIVTEMDYPFQSSLSNIVFDPFRIKVQELRLPRRTATIALCTNDGCTDGREWDTDKKEPKSAS